MTMRFVWLMTGVRLYMCARLRGHLRFELHRGDCAFVFALDMTTFTTAFCCR